MVKINKNKQKKASAASRGPRARIQKTQPAAFQSASGVRQPKIEHLKDGIRVTHREFVKDILSDINNDFAYDVIPLSPSNALSFPWLSNIATNYESYSFERVDVLFKPSASTATNGILVLAVDYDAKDPTDNETKASLLQWQGSTSTSIWSPSSLHCDKVPLNKIGPTRFVNTSQIEADRLSTAGIVYVATTPVSTLTLIDGTPPGLYALAELGELWLEYSIIFKTAVLPGLLGSPDGGTTSIVPKYPQLTAAAATDAFSIDGNNYIGQGPPAAAVRGFDVTPVVEHSTLKTLASYGVSIVNAAANAYFGPANGLGTTTGQKLISFAKDFIGDIILTYKGPGTWAASPPSGVTVKQLAEGYQTDYYIPNAPNAPDFSQNYVGLVTNNVSTSGENARAALVMKAAVQAGTNLLITSGNNWRMNTSGGGQQQAMLRIDSKPFDRSDLDLPPNLLDFDENGVQIQFALKRRPGRKLTKEQHSRVCKSIMEERRFVAESSTSSTSMTAAVGHVIARRGL